MKTKVSKKTKKTDEKKKQTRHDIIRCFNQLDEALGALCSTAAFKDRYRIFGCCLFQLREWDILPEELQDDLEDTLFNFKFDNPKEDSEFVDDVEHMTNRFLYIYQNM